MQGRLVGEVISFLIEQRLNVEPLLNPETPLISHILEIHSLPTAVWL